MRPDDFAEFISVIDFTLRVIRKPAIEDEDVLKAWFIVLAKYSLKQVKDALNVASTHPQSRYGLDPALIVECMNIKEEKELTWKRVLELARMPDHLASPICVLARIHIKSFNLNEKKDLDLHYEAAQFLEALPDMKVRALEGNYTKHEVNVMIERGVRPTAPFMDGMPEYIAKGDLLLKGGKKQVIDPLRLTFESAKDSDYFAEVQARKKSEAQNGLTNLNGRRKVADILSDLFPDDEKQSQEQIDVDNSEFQRLMRGE